MTAKKTKPVAAKNPAPKPKSAPKKVAPAKAVKKPAAKKPVRSRTTAKLESGLTLAQEDAAQDFVLNGDKSAAYRKAFPKSLRWKDKTVNEFASRLFADSKVAARVEELKIQKAAIAKEKFNVDAEYVLRRHVEIDKMDFLDILNDDGSFKHVSEWPLIWRQFLSGFDMSELYEGYGEDREMVGILKKIKWPDKIKNLELLGKHVTVNAYREQVGLSSPNGGAVEVVTADMPDDVAAQLYKEMLAG